MDAAIACDHVYGTMAARALGRLAHARSIEHIPTLAEFLGARGYATAGFVANTCVLRTDSGLGRGFTHYEDFIFPELTALQDGRAGQSRPGRHPDGRRLPRGSAGVRRVAALR